ncbi:lipocalin family protein [Porticoccaceae bacterium]|nr:lipocalin family protein [Porticoccaceae bacterium]MDB9969711.1 lipocalin family protein [Porticoccaceae bacterium]MDC1454071.1 lipocalin family protein [Porticoccaceae bacterium]
MKIFRLVAAAITITLLTACSSQPPMATVDKVDLQRFMGDWYVIANIPTFLEQGAHNPVESYALNADGTIATTFTFNADSFEGEKKIYHPKGFIRNTESNAEWGMQFIWPIKADYRIVYLDDDYQYTVIGRNSRDYVWIMARNAQIPDQIYGELRDFVIDLGYDPELLQKAPHQLPE